MSTTILSDIEAGRQPNVNDRLTTKPYAAAAPNATNDEEEDEEADEEDAPVPGDEDDDDSAEDVADKSPSEIAKIATETESPAVKNQSDG